MLLHVDDSALIVSGNNVADIETTLSSELESVSRHNWLIDNKVCIHLGKTQSVLYGAKRTLSTCVKLNVICNGIIVIESKSNVTYLGVTIDSFHSGQGNYSCQHSIITRGGPCQHGFMCGCKQWSNDINESN